MTTAQRTASHSEAKIGDIQVLRGIAIAMVLFAHLSIGATLSDVFPVRVTLPFYLGVEIFFVVSGYVITRSLMKDDFHAIRFLIKRVFRLMPALLCFIGLTLVLNRYVQEADLPESGKTLLSVSNGVFRQQARGVAFGYLIFLPPGFSYANSAMWSMSVEDQFYAGVTLICLTAGMAWRSRAKRTGPLLATVAASLYLALAGWRLVSAGECVGRAPAVVRYLTWWRFDFLALGVMTAFLDARLGERIRSAFRHSGTFCSAFLLLLPLMLAALCESPLNLDSRFLHGVGYVAMGLCFAGLVLLAANGLAFPASRGPLYRAFKFVGDRSYTYYLFHYPLFIIAWLIFQRCLPSAFHGPWHYAVAQCITVAALLMPFAELVYRWVELPLADFGRNIAARLKGVGIRSGQAASASVVLVSEPSATRRADEAHLRPIRRTSSLSRKN